jgi:hypothetical protein
MALSGVSGVSGRPGGTPPGARRRKSRTRRGSHPRQIAEPLTRRRPDRRRFALVFSEASRMVTSLVVWSTGTRVGPSCHARSIRPHSDGPRGGPPGQTAASLDARQGPHCEAGPTRGHLLRATHREGSVIGMTCGNSRWRPYWPAIHRAKAVRTIAVQRDLIALQVNRRAATSRTRGWGEESDQARVGRGARRSPAACLFGGPIGASHPAAQGGCPPVGPDGLVPPRRSTSLRSGVAVAFSASLSRHGARPGGLGHDPSFQPNAVRGLEGCQRSTGPRMVWVKGVPGRKHERL